MLKFIKHHLTGIQDIEQFPLISFVLFFLFFLTIAWWALRADKKRLEEIKRLPLDEESPENQHV